MKRTVWFFFYCLTITLPLAAQSQTEPKAVPSSSNQEKYIVVSVPVAALVRPILEEKQKGMEQNERKLNSLLYNLTQKHGHAADEALVVLMCFYIGESQEEMDAVIARGKKMLPLLKKYQDRQPKIPGLTNLKSILKGPSSKTDDFAGAVKAINHGWHSTADDPEG